MSIGLMAGIVRGLQDSHDRAMRIAAARDEKRQRDEMFELKKKKFDLAIEEMERSGEWSQYLIDMARQDLDNQIKVQEAQSSVEDTWIKNEDQQNKEYQRAAKSMIRAINPNTGTVNFFNPNWPLQAKPKAGKTAQVNVPQGPTDENLMAGAVNKARGIATETGTGAAKEVRMISPSGKTVMIPMGNIDKAISKGYKKQ